MATRVNRVKFGAFVASATLLLTVSVATIAPAGTAYAADYPSWDEVNAAKQNASSKQGEVDRINGLLGQLESSAAQLGDDAVRKGSEYLKATYAFEAAKQQADTLQSQANSASQKADDANRQLGMLAAQLYRQRSDGGLSVVSSGGNASQLLYQLGTMSKLTERSSQVSSSASSASNVASSIGAQAQVAASERDRLETAAADSLAAAKSAQESANNRVADAKATSGVLYAQLAALKDTSSEVEKRYRDGVAAKEAADEEERRRAAEGGGNGGGGGGGGGGDGSSWIPGGESIASPSDAKAYASSRLGAYGWNQGQFGCLLSLWTRESGWRANAYNESSGAYGIPQSLPASKMASAGDDWQTNAATQIEWGLTYIKGRYGNPCAAWAHSEATNWY